MSHENSFENARIIHDEIVAEINAKIVKIDDPVTRMQLMATLLSSIAAEIVRANLSAGVSKDQATMNQLIRLTHDVLSLSIQEAYLRGSDKVCPCGECQPLEVTVTIRSEVPPLPIPELDETPAPDGTPLN